MPDSSEHVIAGIVAVAVLLSNIVATRLLVRDKDSEFRQKILQAILVWLIPIIGAIIVFVVHRPDEKPTGRYRAPPGPVDDFRDPARSASNRARNDMDLSE